LRFVADGSVPGVNRRRRDDVVLRGVRIAVLVDGEVPRFAGVLVTMSREVKGCRHAIGGSGRVGDKRRVDR